MGASNIMNFKEFYKINENDEDDKPFRLYGTGSTPEAELIDSLKSLIADIKKANPSDQESYDNIKADIRAKSTAIKSHRSYPELKHGIPWQDGFIKLSDWAIELKDAVNTLSQKASRKGLM
jgi:hypothetical protein